MIIDPIWHPMEMHFLSAGYEHHLPPTTTAHVYQRPYMSSRLPRSTDDTHFVAQPRRVTACSVISGPFIPQKCVQDIGGMQGKTSVSQACCRSRL